MSVITILIAFSIFALVLIRSHARNRSMRHVQGPTRPSFWLGHEWVLRHQEDAGDLELKWYHQYGSIVRIGACFGRDALLVSDAKALHYIFQASAPYSYPKTGDHSRLLSLVFGHGVISAQGTVHHRQRKILNPAFSESQLRTFLGLFQSSSYELADKLKREVSSSGKVVNILAWTSHVSLEVIGITSFRYRFGAINGEESELLCGLRRVLSESHFDGSASEIMYASLWRFLPRVVLQVLELFPSREHAHLTKFRQTCESVASGILNETLSAMKDGGDTGEKDVVGLLASALTSPDAKWQTKIDEVLAQMATFIFAGHDTSAGAMAWLLYELSKHPEDQAKVRAEILATHDRKGGQGLSSVDYDSMPYLNATIKETLRLHPFAHSLPRVAAKDDVLPLSEPITTVDGRVVHELPIQRGQVLITSLLNYNRSPSVWGSDAEVWRPSRFLDLETSGENKNSIGLYANLLSFSAGNQSCIGWRYAVMTIQVVTGVFLERFDLALPDEELEMCHAPTQVSSFPAVRGHFHEGPQVPLKVTTRSSRETSGM